MSIVDGENYQIFYVNSKYRENGTDNDFTYNLNLDRSKKYDRIALLNISIPKSYYLVQDGYNTFTLREDITDYIITMRAGNYNRNSFRAMLQEQLNNTGSYTYTITNDNLNTIGDDGKYTFTVSNNSGIQPLFIFADNLYEQLGFNQNTSNQFIGNTLKSVNVNNFTNESTLFLHCDRCTNKYDDILQNIISAGGNDYSYIVWNNDSLEINSKILTSHDMDNIRLYLTDENNVPINLNGLNIVLSFCVYKKRENIDPFIKLDILRKSMK